MRIDGLEKEHASDEDFEISLNWGEIAVYRGADGALVVHIDTNANIGHVRINLNDGPPVFDADPEV